MGDVHTPKTIYGNGLVMEFFVKNKEIFYKLSKWDESGTNLSLIECARLGNKNPDDLMKDAQRLFGKGITE